MKAKAPGRFAARRYPALVLVGAAALLAILLPTTLNVPSSGPTSLAEFAPVPGQGAGRGDVSSFGAGSGSTGFGTRASEASRPDVDSLGAPGQRRARLKRCVGNPPRQTEDPLSPPCVAFFEGDNFGSTAKGVSRDEVNVAMSVDSGQTTDPHYRQMIDCGKPATAEDTGGDTICRAYMKYFNDRYQTYGRTVRLWASHGVDPPDAEQQVRPFIFSSEVDDRRWPQRRTIGANHAGSQRKNHQDLAPFLIAYRPDVEDQARIAGTFICTKLKGRPARFSGNPLDRTRVRKFAIWSTSSQDPFREALSRELREGCGETVETAVGHSDPTISGRLRDGGVTSVILSTTEGGPVFAGQNATQFGWFPEWVIPGVSKFRSFDTNFWARTYDASQWSHAFGITFDYRRDEVEKQWWAKAFKEGCPDCSEPTAVGGSAAPMAYDVLGMVFYGIQAAGPRLTPENVDKGLHAIPQIGSVNPYKPAAYFGPGNYTFVKDAMAIWWDPSGRAPGSASTGCYRLPNGGARRRAGEWAQGDGDLFTPDGAPCQGDTIRGG